MTLRAVFIDVGNTLLYEDPSRFKIYARAARERGVEIEDSAMQQLMGRVHDALPRGTDHASWRYGKAWFHRFIRGVFHEGLELPESALPGLEAQLFAHFDDPGAYQIAMGAEETLRGLAKHDVILGIISNGTDRLPRLLESLELAGYFDFILSSALWGTEKPEPSIFEEALRLASVRPSEAVHVGDDLRLDVEPARRMGLQTVLFDAAGKYADEGLLCRDLRTDPTFSRVETFFQLGKDLSKRLSSGSDPYDS